MPQPCRTDDRVHRLLAQLTVEEKASLTGGADVWHLPSIDRLGIASLKVSDGPSGVRGALWSTRSLAFPCGSAVGATWDVELVHRLGEALADEARAKGVDLLLGPTVGLVRTPLAGRTFESLSEDPCHASRLAVAYVEGVQGGGVGCCVKHFACNDQEHDRHTVDVVVDDRTLHEVHLAPFEAAVTEAGAWSVMAAYNRVNGAFCSESRPLLTEVLREQWGFDGVVVSDWFGTHSTVPAALAGLDVEMPGPPSHLGPALAAAVAAGSVDGSVLDEAATRVLRLLERCGALDRDEPSEEREVDDPRRRRLAREVAVAGTVLLTNDGVLPLDASTLRSVAVVGPKAARLETGGGGSSFVTPFVDASPLDELARRLGDVEVVHAAGCRVDGGSPLLDMRLVPGGFRASFHQTPSSGEPVAVATLHRSDFMAVGPPVPELGPGGFVLRAEGTLEVDEPGVWSLGMAAAGRGRLLLDDEVVVDTTGAGAGDGFFGLGSEPLLAEVELTAGRPRRLVAELTTSGLPIAGFELYGVPPVRPDLLSDAVDAAATADVAVVLVGTDRRWETEGSDRPHLRLPAPQDELVEAVAAANPRTVVVVNAGAPVAMPWIDRVAATLVVWFPGEEGARALAEVLTGVAEPSGRLPISIPCRLDDTASHGWYPGSAGSVTYGERCAVGYRHHLDRGIAARFPFGHGLGYSTFTLGSPAVEPVPEGLRVRVPVTNDGDRRGSEVVQVYADVEGAGPPSIRLAGFAKATIEAEATEVVDVLVRHRAFERWEPTTGRWRLLEGTHELRVGCSSTDVRHRIAVRVPVDGSTRAAADG